jgi:mxaL protein
MTVWPQRHPRLLLGLAALLLAACLLRPSLPLPRQLFNQVVVLDITQSMNVQDHVLNGKPASRLDFAKHALSETLLQLPCGSKIGWALFTEYRSYLLLTPVEVCANLQELRASLAQIDGRMAWTGNSEVAKGLFSGIGIARQLPEKPALVFISDGHEAPPVDPQRRRRFDDKPGEVPGLIVGVGGSAPLPIPKRDALGQNLGFWSADEVTQQDPFVHSARASTSTSTNANSETTRAAGQEHLSSLREAHLRLLAVDTGLAYWRLQLTSELTPALTAPHLARRVLAPADLRPLLGAFALLLLLARHAPERPRRRDQSAS